MGGSGWCSGMGEQELEPVGDAWILKEEAAGCGEMVPGLCREGVEVSWWWPHPGREWHSTLCLVMGSSDSRGEAGRGRVTEGTLGCWDCDILLCHSGGTSLALLRWAHLGSSAVPHHGGTHPKALPRLPGGAAPALGRAGSAQPLVQMEDLGILLPYELNLLFSDPNVFPTLPRQHLISSN